MFTFPRASCWIFILFLHWLSCHCYCCVTEQQQQQLPNSTPRRFPSHLLLYFLFIFYHPRCTLPDSSSVSSLPFLYCCHLTTTTLDYRVRILIVTITQWKNLAHGHWSIFASADTKAKIDQWPCDKFYHSVIVMSIQAKTFFMPLYKKYSVIISSNFLHFGISI